MCLEQSEFVIRIERKCVIQHQYHHQHQPVSNMYHHHHHHHH